MNKFGNLDSGANTQVIIGPTGIKSKEYTILVQLIMTWTGPSPMVQVDLVQRIHRPVSLASEFASG